MSCRVCFISSLRTWTYKLILYIVHSKYFAVSNCLQSPWLILRNQQGLTIFGIQLFWERLSEKNSPQQPRKVIWDMINYTLFLTLYLSKLLLLLSFSTRKHMSMASRAILSNFFEEQWTQHSQTHLHGLSYHSFKFLSRTIKSKPPTIPIGITACNFSDNLSRNSCMRAIYHRFDGIFDFIKITKIERAFWLVKNKWFIVPVNL